MSLEQQLSSLERAVLTLVQKLEAFRPTVTVHDVTGAEVIRGIPQEEPKTTAEVETSADIEEGQDITITGLEEPDELDKPQEKSWEEVCKDLEDYVEPKPPVEKKPKKKKPPEKKKILHETEATPKKVTKAELMAEVHKNITNVMNGDDGFAKEIIYKYQDKATFKDLDEKHYADIYREIKEKNDG